VFCSLFSPWFFFLIFKTICSGYVLNRPGSSNRPSHRFLPVFVESFRFSPALLHGRSIAQLEPDLSPVQPAGPSFKTMVLSDKKPHDQMLKIIQFFYK